MNLKERINEILNMPKFNELDDKQKSTVAECIFAHCLILSQKNQDRYLSTIQNNVSRISDLGDNQLLENGLCYDGVVKAEVDRNPIDSEGNIFPMKYQVFYRELNAPLNRLTRSVLHEFGHVVIKKSEINLLDAIPGKNDTLQFDLGGLIINNSFKNDFGHTFTEVINEFTTFLAFKSYLSYQETSTMSNEKMKEFAKKNGLSIEEQPILLNILPNDLFTSYTEDYLSKQENMEMFNPIYVKYTPLVRLIMKAFQNPCFTFNDLKIAFENGEGLSATKNGEPINDLLYGYYESVFRTKDVFNNIMGENIDWETFCNLFDKETYETSVNNEFIEQSINIFTDFYKKRNELFIKQGLINNEQFENNMSDFYKTVEICREYYNNSKQY